MNKDLITELKKFESPKKKFSINLIKSDHGNLDTEGFDIEIPDLDIEMNYGKEFLKIHKNIVKRLNTNGDKGIVLLHGKPGTGKCVVGDTKIKLRNKKTGEIIEKNIQDLI